MKRSIRPTMPAPSAPVAPVAVAEPPAPTPEPETPAWAEPAAPAKIKRVLFPVWKLGENNYWQRPVRNGESKHGIVQSKLKGEGTVIVINRACSSSATWERIYIEDGYVYALTLGLAYDFDIDGSSGNGDHHSVTQ